MENGQGQKLDWSGVHVGQKTESEMEKMLGETTVGKIKVILL